MWIPVIAVLTGLVPGCRAPPSPGLSPKPAPVPVALDVSAPWSVVRQDVATVVLRHGEGPDGAWVQLAEDERGRTPGVALVVGGRTLWVDEGERTWPLAAPIHEIRTAEVLTQGQDLVVRLTGPPISEVVDNPAAPEDPFLAWTRVRARPGSWRVVSTGMAVLSWPADGSWGEVEVDTRDEVSRGQSGARVWLDTAPSLEHHHPYPEVGLTLSP